MGQVFHSLILAILGPATGLLLQRSCNSVNCSSPEAAPVKYYAHSPQLQAFSQGLGWEECQVLKEAAGQFVSG